MNALISADSSLTCLSAGGGAHPAPEPAVGGRELPRAESGCKMITHREVFFFVLGSVFSERHEKMEQNQKRGMR